MAEITEATKARSALEEMLIWQCLKEKDEVLANKTLDAAEFVAVYLKDYTILFPHYTDHSINHSLNVIKNMAELMISPDKYTAYDLFFCIYSALFHDIGMVVKEAEMTNELNGTSNKYINKQLGHGEPEQVKKKERLLFLQNKIRTEHGNRVHDILNSWALQADYGHLFKIGSTVIVSQISELCKSHMKAVDELENDIVKIKNAPGTYSPLFVAIILRLADAYDFSPDRAPRTTYSNYDIANDKNSCFHWAMHNGAESDITILKDDRSNDIVVTINPTLYDDWKIDNQDKTEDDYLNVQSSIFSYYQWIEQETKESCSVLDCLTNEKYKLSIRLKFSDDPKKFADYIPNFRIKMNYETIVANLLGTGLYGEPRVGLREIVQNSIDACRWRAARAGGYSDGVKPIIEVVIDEQAKEVRITDNGIGMSLEIVKTCFLGIGNSVYNNSAYSMSREQFDHIGKHGIGFFATFMLSDNVKIRTRHLDSTEEIWVSVTSRQENAFIRRNKIAPINVGTQIILRDIDEFKKIFKPVCKDEKNVAHAVRHYIENLFLNDANAITFKVKQIGLDGETDDDMTCDVLPLSEKVKDDLGQIENLTDCFIPANSIECFARFDSKIRERRLFIWDKNKFVETDWMNLPEAQISICTIKKFGHNSDSVKPIVLYVPNVKTDSSTVDPFGLVNSKYREKTYYETSKIFNGAPITIKEFCDSIGFSIEKYPIGAFAERVLIKQKLGSVLLLREGSEFEDSTPRTAYVRSGKEYYDKIYARNVIVPNAHLRAPFMLIGIDGDFTGELQDIIVNIKSNKIYPTLKRDNLSPEDIENVSYAVARALMHRQIRNHKKLAEAIDIIISEFFKKQNIFS